MKEDLVHKKSWRADFEKKSIVFWEENNEASSFIDHTSICINILICSNWGMRKVEFLLKKMILE